MKMPIVLLKPAKIVKNSLTGILIKRGLSQELSLRIIFA